MPVEVFELSTHEREVAHEALTEVYTPERPIRFSGDDADFACQVRSAGTAEVGLDHLSISMGMRTEMAPPDYFMVATHLRGGCQYTAGRDEVALRPGGIYHFSTSDHIISRYDALTVHTLRLPLATLQRVAAERFDGGEQLCFDGHTPLDDDLRRGWLHVSAFAQAQLTGPSAAASNPLVAAALADLIAATALVTFPNTTMGTPTAGPGWVAPAVVRRAVAHIEAHAEQPLTTTDIARASGVGPRALQLAFARHLGTSPTAHLRRVRLQRAHRELQTADATTGDTVAAVARRWGWASPSRFSTAYQREFGVPPSRTLRT